MIKKLVPRRFKKRVMNAWMFSTTQFIVVSYPKSGRTWLRAVLTFYFAERYGLEDPPLLEFANLHYLDSRIPKVFFAHDTARSATPDELTLDKSRYEKKHVLLLTRDPRDVCVSMYFHRKNRYQDLDMPIFDFINGREGGLRTTIEYMNIWAAAFEKLSHSHCLSYESMHTEPHETLAKALRFLGKAPDPHAIDVAIQRARFDRLKSMEKDGTFGGGRLKPADAADNDSFKVRRGKVGGYTDYFDAQEQRDLGELVSESLSPFYRSLLSGS